MVQFYFVRHGESEANLLQIFSNGGTQHPLTSKGRQQALTLAVELADRNVIKLYTSPLLRAVETAEILAGALGVNFEPTDALREYDCGVLEGTGNRAGWETYECVLQNWVAGQWDVCIDGGESYNDMRRRFIPFIEGLIAQYKDQAGAVVLIGHGGIYRCMLPLMLSNVDFAFTVANAISNTGYVVAELHDGKLICREWCGLMLGQLAHR